MPATRRQHRRIALGAACTYAAYLLAGNVLLNTPVAYDLANRQPEKFVASWNAAWTLYPGHFRATGLTLSGHVRHVVWSVQADAVRGRVALLPLLTKVVRVPSMVATGVTGGATRVDVERLPPPSHPGGWTLRFDDIVADDVRLAYFNGVVLQGSGRAEGGFVKTLRGGSMEVLPSHAEFRDGTVWQGEAKLAWDASIRSTLAIAAHRREEAPGIRKLEKTDLEIELDAVTAGLSLENRAGAKPEVVLTEGPGRIEGKLAWARGSLVPGGHLSVAVPVAGNLDGSFESTAARAEVNVADTGIRLAGHVSPVHASVNVDTEMFIGGTTLPLQNFPSLVRRTSGHFASRWNFDSLTWLAALLPGSNLVTFDGAGTVLADLKFHDGKLEAGSYVDIPDVAATASALGNRFAGDAQARITFEDAAEGELRPRLAALMRKFDVAPAESPDRPYVHGTDLRIDAVAHGNRDTLDDRVHARLWFEDAQVPDLRSYNRYLPNSRLQFIGGAGRVSGNLEFDREGGIGSGTFRVVGRSVQLGIADLVLQGDIQVDTVMRRADLKSRTFNADGTRLSLKGVRVKRGDELLETDWWSDVALERARLDWDKPMALDGQLQVRMKDVGVLLALYSQRKDLPAWIQKVVDAGEAGLDGRVQWQQHTLILDPFSASNNRFDVLARLRLHDKQPAGNLYARWGALSVGVELDGTGKHFHLVGARKWFDGQPSLAAR